MEITKEMVILVLALLGFFAMFFVIHLILPKEKFPYCAREILTKNELQLYNTLYCVAIRNGWMVLMKMRLADIIGVRKGTDDYMKYFNKIKAKHTDFVLCDPITLDVLAGIELDDDSHKRPDRIERDVFVNKVYQAADIPLIHVWNPISERELEDILWEYIPSLTGRSFEEESIVIECDDQPEIDPAEEEKPIGEETVMLAEQAEDDHRVELKKAGS